MEVRLKRLDSSARTKILKVPSNGAPKTWLAGRGACCHIYTQSKYASRKHFSITYRENKYYISDLQSSNGTFVNGIKLTSEKILSCGNVIGVGVPLDMPNATDCIFYVFEIHSVPVEKPINVDDDICIIDDTEENCEKAIQTEEVTHSKKKEENVNEDLVIHPNKECVNFNNESLDKDVNLVNEHVNKDVNLVNKPVDKDVNLDNKSLDKNKRKNHVEETAVNTSLNEEVVITASKKSLKRCRNLSSPFSSPAKIRKLEDLEETVDSFEGNKRNYNKQPQNEEKCRFNEEDDMEVYEVPTQVDDPEIKTEKNTLNYSGTEELIEISDSEEEDWSLKNMEGKKWNELLEGEEEDDDVVFIERIIKPKNGNDFPALVNKIKDDLTEVDKKWIGKLLKIKCEPFSESQLGEKVLSVDITDEGKDSAVRHESLTSGEPSIPREEPSDFSLPARENAMPLCDVKSKINLQNDFHLAEPGKTAGIIRKQKKTVQKPSWKKRVSFDLNPKIKYYEIPERVKFTISEKGMLKFTKVIFNICNWNTVWLEECKRVASQKDPPDLCDEPLRKIPKKFTSHTDYMSAYVPAMLLHLWNKVKTNWKNFGDAAFKQTVSCDSYEDYHTENLSVFKCTGLVQSVDAHRQLVREGHLVMLRLHPIRDATSSAGSSKYFKKVGYLVFGYLEAKAYERFHNQTVHEALGERCSSARGDLHLVKLTILVKKRPRLKIDKQKLMQLTVVQNISSEMRIFKGICFLPQSSLFRAILRPSKAEFTLITAPGKPKVFFTGPLDNHQKELVSNLTHTFSSTNSFLFSIHGPAGTGKGQVVIAFIIELLFGRESKKKGKPKIIYCAPSDGPLDEMVVRLKSCRESLGASSRFSMVRVGPIKEIRPEVRDFALPNLTQKYQCSDKGVKNGKKEDLEVEVLKESDVICANCSSTGMRKMFWVFDKKFNHNRNQKIICIIDEANNSRESDSLLPLLLGVTHLLLVGDIHQLNPPFTGEKTGSLGLDVSLFWRIYQNFSSLPKDLWPISILKTQYRMSPGLSRFVDKIIYNTLLQDSLVNASHKITSLRSYLVVVNEESDVDPKSNEQREGRVVFELIKAILKITKEENTKALNLSVITSDSKQTEVIQSFITKREFPEVEISHFQTFQGRETDVVVFTCDGTKLLVSQIAVAMTRARSSLFVVTTQRSISSNPWCQRLSQVAEEKKALKRVHSDSSPEIFERMISE